MSADPAPAEPTANDDPARDPGPHAALDPVLPAPVTELAPLAMEAPPPAAIAPIDPVPAPLVAPPLPVTAPFDPLATGVHPAMSPPPPPELASTTFLVVVTVISLVADLVTKAWAKGRLSNFDAKAHGLKRLPLWKDHIEFIFAQNPGGAWSFLRGLPDTLRRPFFLVVSAAAIVFIISIYQRVHRDQTAMRWGLPLALGGAMGNLVDRMRYGWVVDFIDISMKWGGRDHHWPTFNVADIAIVVGVILMGSDMVRVRRHHPHDHVAHA